MPSKSTITITDILAEMQRLGIAAEACNDEQVKTFAEIKEEWGIGQVQVRSILKKLVASGLAYCKRVHRPRIDGSLTSVPGYVFTLSSVQAKTKGVKREASQENRYSRKDVVRRASKATKKRR